MKYISTAALAAFLPILVLGLQGCGGSSDDRVDDIPTTVTTPAGAVLRAESTAWLTTDSVTSPGACSMWFNVKAKVTSEPGPFPADVAVVAAQAWKADRQMTEVAFEDPSIALPDGRSVESTDSTCVTFDVTPGEAVTVVVEVRAAGREPQRIRTAATPVRTPG